MKRLHWPWRRAASAERVVIASHADRFVYAWSDAGGRLRRRGRALDAAPRARTRGTPLESTSLVFKNTKVVRMVDAKRNTLVYVAVSRRVLEGSPMNSISAVPIMPWAAK